MRLGGVLQWLCWPGLHTGQLYLSFVTWTAKHWLPFYFFRFTYATFMLSLWPVMWNLRYICCQFISHRSFLELLYAFELHSVLISWITVSLPYCRNKYLCCIPSTRSSEWYQPSPSSYACFPLLRECPSWGAQQSHTLYTFKTSLKIHFCDACEKLANLSAYLFHLSHEWLTPSMVPARNLLIKSTSSYSVFTK